MNLIEVLQLRSAAQGRTNFAREVGIDQATIWRYEKGESSAGTTALRAFCQYARRTGDAELLGAALAYAAGVDVDRPAVLGQFVAAMAGEPEAVAA
jgi:transcriptional regulator with XRE-family HTH domain